MQPLRKIDTMQLKSDDKIYLLDDNMFYISIFQQHLVNLGYTDVSIFDSPAACVNKLVPPPDIIIYDHSANFGQDLEILKMIKKQLPEVYLIFACGPDNVATVIQSLKYGVFDYFIKGPDDAKNIEIILTKIQRVRELLSRNNRIRFKNTSAVDSKGVLIFFPND